MTVASTTTRIKHNCSGGTTYTFAFGVDVSSELKVILEDGAGAETTLTETTHYTVSATNNDFSSGGTVTTVAPYDTPNTITILLNVPLSQDSDFIEGMGNLYETFEDALDKLTRIALQSKEVADRALTLPESTSATSALPAMVAEGYLRGNSDASGFEFATLIDSGAISDEAYNATSWLAADDTAPSKKAVSAEMEKKLDSSDLGNVLVKTGTIIDFSGTDAPDGYLVCPTSQTNISRTTYANLFAVIGTTWGVGDGSTTFGMPWFASNYTAVQASANVGTATVGEVISHTHNIGGGPSVSGSYGYTAGDNGLATSAATGGASNLAAGVRVLKCVKY